MSEESIKVAVRVRPLIKSEVQRDCHNCINVIPGEPQIQVHGTEKAFTYNYVFGTHVQQNDIYDTAVKPMIKKIFKGYNVTILAYGQTGSGKTYSMGTNYSPTTPTPGIIPRAIQEIFSTISSLTPQNWDFKVAVSFVELHKEQLFDLLVTSSPSTPRRETLKIRDANGAIRIPNLKEREVTCPEDVLRCLTVGSQVRTTAATAMNVHSSRSHAIFTITIKQQRRNEPNTATTSKFHLVDLAGSERVKKTQTTGDRFKEGASINLGLLALGNVLSDLGENAPHIRYKDNALTRLLQDSLGGNSFTLMIACVSPADYNLKETLNTLEYANRAKKIKNKPIVNEDPSTVEITRLKATVKILEMSLLDKTGDNSEQFDLTEENESLQKNVQELKQQLNNNLVEFVEMQERVILAEQYQEQMREQIGKLSEEIQSVIDEKDIKEVISKLQNVQKTLMNLQNFQKHPEMNHHLSLDENSNEIPFNKVYTEPNLVQENRNKSLMTINQELAIKEQLIAELSSNSSVNDHNKKLREMETEIESLQREREHLLKILEDVQNNNNTSAKVAEIRRKRVMELEKKISKLSKKCAKQSRLLKLKEKTDTQIKILTEEIHLMKQIRDKLVLDMRQDAVNFEKYKFLREKTEGELQEKYDELLDNYDAAKTELEMYKTKYKSLEIGNSAKSKESEMRTPAWTSCVFSLKKFRKILGKGDGKRGKRPIDHAQKCQCEGDEREKTKCRCFEESSEHWKSYRKDDRKNP